ncbi:hypothetical protein EVJ58_g5916 [Rhodofomes roseus]|uniref:Uncharacterized protein n=1 Tax=Rhodofomes roseus TaxID=34475 RepID=A0A4Y9YBW0_9APHY|nr:hypothetical protein EVJ58_g5916 [Rhodofomes roseus]
MSLRNVSASSVILPPSKHRTHTPQCPRAPPPPPAVEFEHGAPYVDFIDIASPTTLVHYLTHKGTSAHVVTIKHCSSLQAEVLHALAKPTTLDLQGEELGWSSLLCPHLTVLRIIGCEQFRSADLRAVLEARLNIWEATDLTTEDFVDFVSRPVEKLCVRDCGELALDDKEWFDMNLEHVSWDAWEGGSVQ